MIDQCVRNGQNPMSKLPHRPPATGADAAVLGNIKHHDGTLHDDGARGRCGVPGQPKKAWNLMLTGPTCQLSVFLLHVDAHIPDRVNPVHRANKTAGETQIRVSNQGDFRGCLWVEGGRVDQRGEPHQATSGRYDWATIVLTRPAGSMPRGSMCMIDLTSQALPPSTAVNIV